MFVIETKGESSNTNNLSAIHLFCKKVTMLDIRINGDK